MASTLSYEHDLPIIRQAIRNKLDNERGVDRVDEAYIRVHKDDDPPHISVGVLYQIDNGKLLVRSRFDLPLHFELRHVHNEIDQIAEKIKQARRIYWLHGCPPHVPETDLGGTGLRGLWPE